LAIKDRKRALKQTEVMKQQAQQDHMFTKEEN